MSSIKPEPNIIRVSQDHVYEYDRKLYNTNNLWARQHVNRPDDYNEVLKRGNTKNWIDGNVPKITLGIKDTTWMLKAAQTGLLTGRFYNFYDIELERTVETYQHLFPDYLQSSVSKENQPGWFVRVERVSLKEGQHGKGPYTNLKQVIESICSGAQGHECISEDDNMESFNIYFLPWKSIKNEFRVFVYQNEISAICPQNYSSINDDLIEMDKNGKLVNFIQSIIDHFNLSLKNRLEKIVGPNYTMDLALLYDDSFYFIEPNSFGENYAAGSALFEWTLEHDLLHKEPGEPVTFKFVDREY